jgi:glucosamine--fructose-6-phosphate aminotransferase (isomerizing)
MQPQMTHFLRDILRQPEELRWTLEHLTGAGAQAIAEAAATLRDAKHVYLTGIGSSWHAALNVAPMFYEAARPVYLIEASELLEFGEFPANSAVIAISRSGRSIEIVRLLEKTKRAGAATIGITNAPEGTLAKEAEFPIVVPIALDHAISVNTYSTLAAAAGIVAKTAIGRFGAQDARDLAGAVDQVVRAIPGWQKQIAGSKWFTPGRTTYFLARGSSLGTAQEARLLWEEGVKAPATAMGTGVFRHGPQEMVREGMRFGMWLDAARMWGQDLATARDLQKLGASVMLIGQGIPVDAVDLVFELPKIAGQWQFLVDCIPAQLAAEELARRSGEDSDTFRLCSFVVEDEAGLLGGATGEGATS